jgi:hypothetical protein
VLDLRFSDTFIRACTVPPIANLPAGDAVDKRRGIYLGYARAMGRDLVSTGSFPGAGRVTDGVQDVPGGASDIPFFSVRAFWKMRKVGDVLVMTGSLFTDDSSTPAVETTDGPNSMRFRRINKAD